MPEFEGLPVASDMIINDQQQNNHENGTSNATSTEEFPLHQIIEGSKRVSTEYTPTQLDEGLSP